MSGFSQHRNGVTSFCWRRFCSSSSNMTIVSLFKRRIRSVLQEGKDSNINMNQIIFTLELQDISFEHRHRDVHMCNSHITEPVM